MTLSAEEARERTDRLRAALIEGGGFALAVGSGRPDPRRPSIYTYFIWAEVPGQHIGPIKIGCAGDPVARLYQLQTASPFELMLIGYVPGGEKLERELHQKYEHLRLRGEWFQPTEEMEHHIFDLILDNGVAVMEGLK